MNCEGQGFSARYVHSKYPRRYRSFFIADILGNDTEVRSEQTERVLDADSEKNARSCEETDDGKDLKHSAGYISSSHKQESSSLPTEPLTTINYDNDLPGHLKSRSPFLAEQRQALEETFQQTKYISSSKRKELSMNLKLTERQIKTWFQNRRTKWRKIRGSEGLRRQDIWKMSSDSGVKQILSNIDGGINGLPKDWVSTLYSLISKH